MQRIPIAATPNQAFSITLGGQQCRITLRQLTTGLYINLTVSGVPVISTMLCRDRVRLVRDAYRGFLGNLAFVDTQGVSDPEYSGLGSRYVLAYVQ